jgi:hypothetical protein
MEQEPACSLGEGKLVEEDAGSMGSSPEAERRQEVPVPLGSKRLLGVGWRTPKDGAAGCKEPGREVLLEE